MRVAIITESFAPDVNGVVHCVLRVAELLTKQGHHPLVIAPRPPRDTRDPGPFPYPVVRVPAVPLPGYPSFRLGLPSHRVREALIRHRAEVVHLASPVFLGAHGAAVARRLGLPTVAVYQTNLPSYARAYRLGRTGEAFAWRWLRGIHNEAARTLAPSTATATGLLSRGIGNVWLWGRGVDTRRFNPARRSEQLRTALLAQGGTALPAHGGTALPAHGGTALPAHGGTALPAHGGRAQAPGGEVIAGYVGRLATEKRVELLAGITALDRVRLVIVGAGPAEAMLRQHIPDAIFLGERRGMSWRPSTPASTCSCTADRMRRSGRRCRRPPRAGFRWWRRPPGGPLDLVENGVTGYLVPPSDPGAFTAAVARLAADAAAAKVAI